MDLHYHFLRTLLPHQSHPRNWNQSISPLRTFHSHDLYQLKNNLELTFASSLPLLFVEFLRPNPFLRQNSAFDLASRYLDLSSFLYFDLLNPCCLSHFCNLSAAPPILLFHVLSLGPLLDPRRSLAESLPIFPAFIYECSLFLELADRTLEL